MASPSQSLGWVNCLAPSSQRTARVAVLAFFVSIRETVVIVEFEGAIRAFVDAPLELFSAALRHAARRCRAAAANPPAQRAATCRAAPGPGPAARLEGALPSSSRTSRTGRQVHVAVRGPLRGDRRHQEGRPEHVLVAAVAHGRVVREIQHQRPHEWRTGAVRAPGERVEIRQQLVAQIQVLHADALRLGAIRPDLVVRPGAVRAEGWAGRRRIGTSETYNSS